MLTSNKDLRKVLRRAAESGWSFKRGRKNMHIKAKHPSGKTATISSTPSDWRAILNIMRDLKIDDG